MTDKMRDEFEAWAKNHLIYSDDSEDVEGFDMRMECAYYVRTETQAAWEAWQASRDRMVVESPEDFTSGGNPNARILIAHHREIVGRWVQSIETAGAKVKP